VHPELDVEKPKDTEPEPVPEPEVEPEPTIEPEPEKTPGPTPAPVAENAPETAPADDKAPANTAPADKAPLQPHTHPQPLSGKQIAAIVAAAFVVVLVSGSIGYAVVSGRSPMSLISALQPKPVATPVATASPTPSASPEASASPDATVTPAPAATASPAPAAADPATANAQRKSDLAAYAAAYKATANNGYYDVTPPSVSVSATDPTTGAAYVISKNAVTAVGQIRYWPGGVCSGTPRTPGTSGTKYLALQTLLDGQSTPYCLEVK
jgi:hypothetical protein